MEWHNLPATISDGMLKVGNHEVMHVSELPIMSAMADLGCVKGARVLEIGFGLGVLSKEIRKRRPASHTIIEAHPTVAVSARLWGKTSAAVIEGYWQDIVPYMLMDQFDVVFHDYYCNRPGDDILGILPHIPGIIAKGGRYVPWSGIPDFFDRDWLKGMFRVFSEVTLRKIETIPCPTYPETQMVLAVGRK